LFEIIERFKKTPHESDETTQQGFKACSESHSSAKRKDERGNFSVLSEASMKFAILVDFNNSQQIAILTSQVKTKLLRRVGMKPRS
jgi:hypothetical protein